MLDCINRTHRRFVGVLSGASARLPLTQEVPALVKSYLEPTETLYLLLRQCLVALALTEVVLFVGELLDARYYVVGRRGNHLPSESRWVNLRPLPRGWSSSQLV